MASLARKSRRAKRREKRNNANNSDTASVTSTITNDSTLGTTAETNTEGQTTKSLSPSSQTVFEILTASGTDPEALAEEIVNYISSAASDKLTSVDDLASILSSMEIITSDNAQQEDDETVEQTTNKIADKIINALKPKETETNADDHKKIAIQKLSSQQAIRSTSYVSAVGYEKTICQ